MSRLNIALVHDYLNQMGGAERVVLNLHNIFPEAPIFTSIFDPQKMPAEFSALAVKTSFMQKLPLVHRFFKLYFMLYPLAFWNFRLDGYNVILSSSSAYAKGIRKPKNAVHICYCHTPARFIWMFEHYMQSSSLPFFIRAGIKLLTLPLRWWDLWSSRQVDYFIANSQNVAQRIQKIYKRDSVIINPPVAVAKFKPVEKIGTYFLIVSRLNSYKRVDIAIEAFNQLKLPLIIIGDGEDRARLQRLAGDSIRFLGHLDDVTLLRYYAECQALIFPGEEDFGITPVEAMASGRPVIAFGCGGALETVVEGKTGIFFHAQTAAALVEAVKKFENSQFDPGQIREHARQFDEAKFAQKINQLVAQVQRADVAGK